MRRMLPTVLLLALAIPPVATSCGGGGVQPGGAQTPAGIGASSAAGGASSVIGPAGGSVSMSDGTSVTVPAGALAIAQTITITPSPPSSGPDGAILVGPRYDFGPDGVTFSRPVTVTLAYDPALLPAGKTPSDIRVFMVPSGSRDFTWLPTTRVDATHVSAPAPHFTGLGTAVETCNGPVANTDPLAVFTPAKQATILQQWDPTETSACRPKFCDGMRGLSPDPEASQGSRMARYHLDPGCSGHLLPGASPHRNCLRSNKTGVKALACVDVEYVTGPATEGVASNTEGDLVCVQCPVDPGLEPEQGALCQQSQVDLATIRYPIYNLRGSRLNEAKSWFSEALVPQRKLALREISLLNVVRIIAPELGFCEIAPFRSQTPGSAWKYDVNRVDLNREMKFIDDGTCFSAPGSPQDPQGCRPDTIGTALEIIRPNVSRYRSFNVYLRALKDAQYNLDVETFALALLHEMRHMGTDNYGFGEASFEPVSGTTEGRAAIENRNSNVASVEHMLNELEDYKVMFQHPWALHAMSPAVLAQAHLDFKKGEDQERSCFAWQWGVLTGSGSPTGYDGLPPDKPGEQPQNVGPLVPLTAAGWQEATEPKCASGDRLVDARPVAPPGPADQRCAVATWAVAHNWMAQQMFRSGSPQFSGGMPLMLPLPGRLGGPLHAPGPPADPNTAVWNILAHWAPPGFPLFRRLKSYCADRPHVEL